MTSQLSIRLLGGLTIERDGQAVTGLVTRKAELLVAYLALERRPHARETLATLLWDDRSRKQGLSNLRTLLASLRKHLEPFLNITRETAALQGDGVWLDARRFERALAAQQQANPPDFSALERALALYQGDFMDGVFVHDGRGIEEWIISTRERLRQQAMEARFQLARHYLHARRYSHGVRHAQALVRLEPYREDGHRLLMRLLAYHGQHNAAVAQYEQCRQVLQEEIGVAPSPETTALYERLLRARQRAPLRLPPQPTPFVGRRRELDAIGNRLDDPACRLLTLVGAGGAGKTRLALQVAEARRDDYLNGVTFASLAGASAATAPTAVAAAMGLSLEGKTPARQQVLDYLRGQELLLVLDNLEHLGEQGAALVQSILDAAPHVQILATSRQPLQLRAEWLSRVGGLAFLQESGEPPAAGRSQSHDAVHLFVACIRRVRPDLALDGQTARAIHRICRLVQGLPLAIELAAGALWQHTPAEAAAQIEHNLDFLAGSLHDAPARQRSMRATFAYSWDLLSSDEQQFFAALSVFAGSFSAGAAAAVSGEAQRAQALLPALAAKSLLQPDGEGRYRLHELLQRYAAEQLARAPAREMAAQERHGAYYLDLLCDLHGDSQGPRAVEATVALAEHMENVRQAWQWAVAQQDEALINRALHPLYTFYVIRCWYEEGDEMLGSAAAMIEALPQNRERELLAARIWARQGKLCETTTYSGRAERLYRRSLALFGEHDVHEEIGMPLQGLGFLAYMQGDNAQARNYLQDSLAAFERVGQPAGMAAALNTLAQVARRQGEFGEAQEACRRGLQIRRELGDLKGVASSLNILGLILAETGEFEEAQEALQESVSLSRRLDNRTGVSNALANLVQVAFQLGDKEAARRYAEEGLDAYRELGDRWGVAISLNNLGCLADERGDLTEARRLFQESVAIYRDVGVRSGLSTALGNLGDAYVLLGQLDEAAASLCEALQVAAAGKDTPNMLLALGGLGCLLLEQGHEERALPLLLFVRDHPKNRPWSRNKIAARLSSLLLELPQAQQTRLKAESRTLTLDELVDRFLRHDDG
ncbi:MAG TPA: tetratricopeptide repeat protein [Candidatus Sulfomarinibacteraceae bacterium]|nr:tetratricopeptide repeat protein [Candidatus Sulfomarinibacteraceae bacterium]